MNSDALVQLALNALSCTQKELARRLQVSPTQISKWKKGEHMSQELEMKIRSLTGLVDEHPEFVLWAGSLQNSRKWERLIHFLAQWTIEEAETGYDTYPLLDELGTLCWSTFYTLREMGVDLPLKFPEELDIEYEEALHSGEDDDQTLWELLDKNPYSALIHQIYLSLNDVYGFYAAYISDFLDENELDMFETVAEIECGLIDLAASKIEVDSQFATNFMQFRHRVTQDYDKWLNLIKEKAFRAGLPLRAELLSMVHGSHEELGHAAEAESLGFNSSRIHPDIYMNELLCGMRVIHQVLPAIMKKLGIDQDFELDESELQAK